MATIIIVVIGIVLLFWKDLIKMLNIPSISVSSNTSGIFFGALAYIALLLLLYRVFPGAWSAWYHSDWFWLSQILIILGVIGLGTNKLFTGGAILIIGILFAYLDTKSNIVLYSDSHTYNWDMSAGEVRSLNIEEVNRLKISKQEYPVYIITTNGDTVIKEPRKNERFIYQSTATTDINNCGSGTWNILSKEDQHIEIKIF